MTIDEYFDNGVLPIHHGGTGASTAAGARNELGLGNTTGPVPVESGGTDATTAVAALANLGVSTGEKIIRIGDIKIQWGSVVDMGGTGVIVTFAEPYSSGTSYSVVATLAKASGSGSIAANVLKIYVKTATEFRFWQQGTPAVYGGVDWIAIGT